MAYQRLRWLGKPCIIGRRYKVGCIEQTQRDGHVLPGPTCVEDTYNFQHWYFQSLDSAELHAHHQVALDKARARRQ